MVHQARSARHTSDLCRLVPLLLVTPLAAQALDCDLGDLDKARARLAAHRIPAEQDFYLELELRGHRTGEATSPLLSSKEQDWLLAADESGSWRWQLTNKGGSLVYAPTAARQPLFDDEWHRIGFSVHRARNEARLYFDGRNVAVYSMNGLSIGPDQGLSIGSGLEGRGRRLRIYHDSLPIPASDIATETPELLSVLAWNIWHGGRENGERIGVQQVIDVIRDSKADLICMQETYGSGPHIADALGYYFFLRSSNLSILSRYPIAESLDLYRPFNFGGALIRAGKLNLRVYSLWLHHLPSLSTSLARPDCNPASLVAGEWQTRAKEMRDILEAIRPTMQSRDALPVIIGGDFNSPSHLDWIERTADRPFHRGHVVRWPVSALCTEAGLTDGYRAVHTDPRRSPGITWSPRFGATQRIDYVYHRSSRLVPVSARVIDSHAARFPSDHAAVLVQYRVEQ